jgi:hypothetical protein
VNANCPTREYRCHIAVMLVFQNVAASAVARWVSPEYGRQKATFRNIPRLASFVGGAGARRDVNA